MILADQIWIKNGRVYGKRIRSAMLNNTGLQLSAYVSYTHEDESQKATYRYEHWRMQRLRASKKKYDAKGKFNFYEPIQT